MDYNERYILDKLVKTVRVCGRSSDGIAGSNPTGGMSVMSVVVVR
jgi:hypothetical protein